MEFYVNSQKIDITIENEKTVGDVLKAFETEFEKNGATTVGITLNGKTVDASSFDEINSAPLCEDTKLELEILTQNQIVQELLDEAGAFRALSEKLDELPADFQSGRDKVANLVIATLAEVVDRFCQSIKRTAFFPQKFEAFQSTQIDGKTIADFFQDFTPIFSDFEQAISSGDTVLLGDLAEYEIRPRIESIADAVTKTVNF